jgi:hypothetical protein
VTAILAADPGKKCGLARYDLGRLATATIDGDDLDTIIAVMTDFRDDTEGRGIVIVEGQHAAQDGHGRVVNVQSVIKLVERRTLLVAVARTLGLRVEVVLATTWQGPCFRSVPRFDDAGELLDTKTRAGLFVAQRITGVTRGGVPGAGGKTKLVLGSKLPKDERDAAAIALYWATWGTK